MRLECEYRSVGESAPGVGRRGQRWASGFTSVHAFLQLSQAGFLTALVPAHLLRLYQLLLFSLPGTPVFSYGDEIGLEVAALPGLVRLAVFPHAPGGGVGWWLCSSVPGTVRMVASRREPWVELRLIPAQPPNQSLCGLGESFPCHRLDRLFRGIAFLVGIQ